MLTMTLFREKETDILKEQIDKLNIAIMKEEEKAHDLETKAQYVILLAYIKLHLHVNEKDSSHRCTAYRLK